MASPRGPASPDELVDLASRLARSAGEVLRDRPAHLTAGAKSTPTDAVTEMDRAAERIILDGLAAERPDDAVVSEESDGRSGSSGVTWYVDPLDGTVNYLYGLAPYSVSIAAAIDDTLVCGVVRDVAHDVEFAAVVGQGARRDGQLLACTTQPDPAFALVATGFGYDARRRAAQARALTTVLPRVRDIRRIGSAALDLCAVASGTVDAFYEAGMFAWDWSAGAVIAREAGARVDGLQGRPPGAHTTLAANPALFDALHEILVAADADEAAPDREPVVGPDS
jgi:myo-inositol-1(or 4)-monophosphatase